MPAVCSSPTINISDIRIGVCSTHTEANTDVRRGGGYFAVWADAMVIKINLHRKTQTVLYLTGTCGMLCSHLHRSLNIIRRIISDISCIFLILLHCYVLTWSSYSCPTNQYRYVIIFEYSSLILCDTSWVNEKYAMTWNVYSRCLCNMWTSSDNFLRINGI